MYDADGAGDAERDCTVRADVCGTCRGELVATADALGGALAAGGSAAGASVADDESADAVGDSASVVVDGAG